MPTEKRLIAFFCIRALENEKKLTGEPSLDPAVRIVTVPCSSKIEMLSLIKTFENGADAVLIAACPEGDCSLVDGCHRAISTVKETKRLLDEIGIESERLEIFQIGTEECPTSKHALDTMINRLNRLGG